MTPRTWRRVATAIAVAVLATARANPAFAYLKFGFEIDGRQVALKWQHAPVRYFVTDTGVPGVTAVDLQAAVQRAFATWEAVPTASISYAFAGFTANLPGEDDGRTTLGFLNEPSLDRVLAQTSYLVDGVTGELLDADVFFNSAFPWSVAASGQADQWDLESVALHEVGHLSGLGHSALGETEWSSGGGRRVQSVGSVMFPIALGAGDVSGRTLDADDVAGISDLYPDRDFNAVTGSVSGRITKNGRGLFGAHVVAFDPGSGERVGSFTLSETGQFSIAGLHPGPHVVRVEPLDDANIESFFEDVEHVDLDFRIAYHERLIVVPRGGDSGAIEVLVVPK